MQLFYKSGALTRVGVNATLFTLLLDGRLQSVLSDKSDSPPYFHVEAGIYSR